jgi:hypothetical protein
MFDTLFRFTFITYVACDQLCTISSIHVEPHSLQRKHVTVYIDFVYQGSRQENQARRRYL